MKPLHGIATSPAADMKAGNRLMKTGDKHVSHRNMICPRIGVTIILTALSFLVETALSLGERKQTATATPMAHTSVKNKARGDTK